MKEDRWWLFLQSNLCGFDEMKYSKAFLLRQPNNVAANERLPWPICWNFPFGSIKDRNKDFKQSAFCGGSTTGVQICVINGEKLEFYFASGNLAGANFKPLLCAPAAAGNLH